MAAPPTMAEDTRTAPIVDRSDVLVVGGGPAGVSAAVAAARSGARVTLIERYPYLGGLASGGMVLVLDDMVNGAEITTLEGLGTPERPHPLQKAFIDEQAAQCGFCLSGVILTAAAVLKQNPKAARRDIQQALSTVLCRCFTHTRMLRAITRYAEETRG